MLFSNLLLLAFGGAGLASAKFSWTFEDATVSVQGKGTGEGGQFTKEKLSPSRPLPSAITLGSKDTLKLLLTTKDGSSAKRPHQAFLTLRDDSTGLEDSFPLAVKDSGKGKVDITHKTLPIQLLTTTSPLKATLLIASVGSTEPFTAHVFDLSVSRDSSTPIQAPPAPLRYGKLPEIHHIFRQDPQSPNILITALFGAAVFATLPVLLGTWLTLGMNFWHVSDAFGAAPVAHGLFFGSLLALEGIFGMYYVRWNLFQTLPPALGVGLVAFLSGSRALSEVQERRLAGKR